MLQELGSGLPGTAVRLFFVTAMGTHVLRIGSPVAVAPVGLGVPAFSSIPSTGYGPQHVAGAYNAHRKASAKDANRPTLPNPQSIALQVSVIFLPNTAQKPKVVGVCQPIPALPQTTHNLHTGCHYRRFSSLSQHDVRSSPAPCSY